MKQTIFTNVTTAINLVCTMPSRRVEILEDGSVTAQGLVITPKGGVAETILPTAQPYLIEDKVGTGDNKGRILGHPVQVYRAADIYGTVASKGTATTVVMREYE